MCVLFLNFVSHSSIEMQMTFVHLYPAVFLRYCGFAKARTSNNNKHPCFKAMGLNFLPGRHLAMSGNFGCHNGGVVALLASNG